MHVSSSLSGSLVDNNGAMAAGISQATPMVRKKRKTTKVRTGCLTCRQRHVKCDERKPVCQRCDNVKLDCKGLGYGNSILVKYSTTLRGPLQVETSLLLQPSSDWFTYKDVDFQYFQLFRTYTAVDLSGYFKSDFWNQLLLQQGHYNHSIKYAIIAVGALYKSIQIAEISKLVSETSPDYLKHLESALQHYQRAICSQRTAIEAKLAPYRTSLISCLLFAWFEALQGHQMLAMQQIITGIHLLKEYGSPYSENIDEELFQIFARLEIQLQVIADARPQRYSSSQTFPRPICSAARDPPSTSQAAIKSLEEARRSWDLLYSRVLYARHRAEPYRYSSQQEVPLEIFLEVRRRTQELLSWRATSDYLFQEDWNNISEQNRVGASAIRISYHFAYIKISTSFELTETVYDSFYTDFQEIVRLSKYLHQRKRLSLFQKATFTLDSVTGVPLFLVGMKCRDRCLRYKASTLLRQFERRESIWDSTMAAAIIDWTISVEEAGLQPDEVVPEGNRMRMLDIECDLKERTAWARYGQHIPGADDYVNIRELHITY